MALSFPTTIDGYQVVVNSEDVSSPIDSGPVELVLSAPAGTRILGGTGSLLTKHTDGTITAVYPVSTIISAAGDSLTVVGFLPDTLPPVYTITAIATVANQPAPPMPSVDHHTTI